MTNLKALKLQPQLDLIDVRHQLRALRSLHLGEPRAAILINRVLAKIAHLHEPDNKAHEQRLRRLIAETIKAVEELSSTDTKAE